jgi:Bacterial regulatory proteins, gntR family
VKSSGSVEHKEIKVGDIDLAELFLSQGLKVTPRGPHPKYIRTVPLAWAMRAAALPGKSLAVGIVIWYLAGISKRHTIVLSNKVRKEFGVKRNSGRRALKQLEVAGLVRVERSGNKSPRVTILEIV